MNILTVMDIKRINMGGETDSPTNHEKVRASKRKTKDADRLKDASNGDHKWESAWTWMNLRLDL